MQGVSTVGVYNHAMHRGLTNERQECLLLMMITSNHHFIMASSKIADATVSFVGKDPESRVNLKSELFIKLTSFKHVILGLHTIPAS